jgi:hypothetical protein
MEGETNKGRNRMIRFIASSTFTLMIATSVQAMTPAPIARPDGMITQVAFGCGVGQTLINGQCVARTHIRQARRSYRYNAAGIAGPEAVNYAGIAGAAGTAAVAAGTTPYYAGVVRPVVNADVVQPVFAGAVPAYYTEPHYSPYYHPIANNPWYAVRTYYAGGPWYSGSNGWADYAARSGIVCTPGTSIRGGDGIMYVCQ